MEIPGGVPPGPGRTPPPPETAGPGECAATWRYTAPALDRSVPGARQAVRDLIRRRRVPLHDDALHGLLLIVSELVTNAVQHAALLSPELAVEVSIGPSWVKVAVEDDHPCRPRPVRVHAGEEPRTGGRGLLLVQAIVAEAGGRYDVERTASGGKVVWAALPLPPSVTSPPRPR
ncbi:two-component sensor histidine kinase [Streptomyces olivoverticillatus]|uniref:Two-component sensor histidine kinase n=1 Tax=Streptomyces olivoverticillatus TaxID=66427 RepID=A0A7W7LS63_9ACTN|nr:ATP-binding protein [Streptomyces olivoverticillatus]MBB4895332.1 two-component sensor histidine kinase [Streptomyces olivoverticillatus]